MLPIQKNITTANYNKGTGTDRIKFIVIHYTGNDGDTAWANTNYFKSVDRGASAHYFVDETSIWQCVEDKDIAWHCGANTYYNDCRNSNSIGVEMCSDKKNGVFYFTDKTVENTVELVRYLMKKYNVPISNVVRHWDVTRKICPAPYCNSTANNKAWEAFKAKLTATTSTTTATASTTASTTAKATTSTATTLPDVTYQVYTAKSKWLPNVKNDTDYAGVVGQPIQGLKAKLSKGSIMYQVHLVGNSKNNWLPWVADLEDYAGLYGKNIDCVRAKLVGNPNYSIQLRVAPVGGSYYPWVTDNNDYAGVYGKTIDCLQMRIVKK